MCGVKIEYQGKQILSIKGDEKDPFSQGHICPKAIALQDLYEDPDRLTKPLVKTANGWQQVEWSDALDVAAAGIAKLQNQHGKDSLATYLGNPNVHNTGNMVLGRYLHEALKTKSRYSATSVDQLPHHIVSYHLFGHQLKIPVPDLDRTDYLLMLGANPMVSNGSIMTSPNIRKRLNAIKAREGSIVVIDPRRTETAAIATDHHFIKPGTDALFLLAMVNVIYSEGKLNPGKLAAMTPELNAIEQYVLPYTPEKVAAITGISAPTIRNITLDFCAAERAVCYGRMGISVQKFGLLSQYLVMLVNILTGRLDAEGGLMFTKPAFDVLSRSNPGYFGKKTSRVRGLPNFSGEFPVATLAEEILEPGERQIKGLVTVAGNPVLSTPNGARLHQALQTLDFYVAIDFYLNETTQHANVILPPVSPLEREHFDVVFNSFAVRNTVKYSPALFEPEGDAKHDWQIYFELHKRLTEGAGKRKPLGKKLFQRGLAKSGPKLLIDLMLRSGPYGGGLNLLKGLTLKKVKQAVHGLDLGALKSELPGSLWHKDKKIHLNLEFYMADLARLDKTLLDGSLDEVQANTPFEALLIGRRDVRTNNSWMHNSKRLVKGKNRCTAHIHPDHAKSLGLDAGQDLAVSNGDSCIVVAPEITDTIMPGVISIPHGWGHSFKNTKLTIASQHAGVSVNDITDSTEVDELCGNAVLNGVPVTLEPVEPKVAR